MPMKFHVYILRSKVSGRYYCGQTGNLTDRLERHNGGRSKATKADRPWMLAWSRELLTRSEAVKLEAKIKSRGIERYLEDEKRYAFLHKKESED